MVPAINDPANESCKSDHHQQKLPRPAFRQRLPWNIVLWLQGHVRDQFFFMSKLHRFGENLILPGSPAPAPIRGCASSTAGPQPRTLRHHRCALLPVPLQPRAFSSEIINWEQHHIFALHTRHSFPTAGILQQLSISHPGSSAAALNPENPSTRSKPEALCLSLIISAFMSVQLSHSISADSGNAAPWDTAEAAESTEAAPKALSVDLGA